MATLIYESCLYFDDSEFKYQVIPNVDVSNKQSLIQAIDTVWDENGEDVLNEEIANGIMSIDYTKGNSFTIIEHPSTICFDSCKRVFTFRVE